MALADPGLNAYQLTAEDRQEHPASWAGAWWDNEPTVRIVAAFAGDAASHDTALRPRLTVVQDAGVWLTIQRMP